MHTRDLLPGVTSADCPPVVHHDSLRTVTRARRRAMFADASQLFLLVGVDVFFMRWPAAHFPTLDRDGSMVLLLIANAAMLGYLWTSRAIPRWTAHRIARTWCAREQSRFFTGER